MVGKPMIRKSENTVEWLVDGEPFLVLGGEVHNSSSSSMAHMEEIWGKVKALNLNTLLMPVYWELVEPEEGVFDFTLPEMLIKRAHEEGLRLIFLWFATWKNAMSHYVPEWVKVDQKRFFRAQSTYGEIRPTISPLCEASRELDGRALNGLMKHIKKVDVHHTVIGMQIENETGLLYSPRDCCKEANTAFEAPLPASLAAYLMENRESLHPLLLKHTNFCKLDASWKEAFGALAEEAFMAYYTARYVGSVAEEGKKGYDLPMFANAWPLQCKNEPGGVHPSGGPVDTMHDLWRCAAPQLDALAADLYLENFAEECAAYSRLKGNPLIIPEARPDKWVMAHAFYAFGEADALCFSPFGIEDVGHIVEPHAGAVVQSVFQTFAAIDTTELIQDTYGILASLKDWIVKHHGTGKMHGILQDRLMSQVVELSDYHAVITFANHIDRMAFPAGGLVIELGKDDFLFAGAGFSVKLIPKPGEAFRCDYLSMEEGSVVAGEWQRRRRLNGDELHPVMPQKPGMLRIRLYRY